VLLRSVWDEFVFFSVSCFRYIISGSWILKQFFHAVTSDDPSYSVTVTIKTIHSSAKHNYAFKSLQINYIIYFLYTDTILNHQINTYSLEYI
jgi:hypothetical protein